MKKIISILALLLLTCACTLTDASLPLNARNVNTPPGLLSQVRGKQFNITKATDSRPRKLIGHKTNSFGMKTADVNSQTPVEYVVAQAFGKMLQVNGHSFNQNNPDINVEIDVRKFNFENEVNFMSMEATAFSEANFKLIDARTSQTLLDKTYEGDAYKKAYVLYLKDWQQSLNYALEDMITKISLSPEFKNSILR